MLIWLFLGSFIFLYLLIKTETLYENKPNHITLVLYGVASSLVLPVAGFTLLVMSEFILKATHIKHQDMLTAVTKIYLEKPLIITSALIIFILIGTIECIKDERPLLKDKKENLK